MLDQASIVFDCNQVLLNEKKKFDFDVDGN